MSPAKLRGSLFFYEGGVSQRLALSLKYWLVGSEFDAQRVTSRQTEAH
jgi:hypothetical protein